MSGLLLSPEFWAAVAGLVGLVVGIWNQFFSRRAQRRREEKKRLQEAAQKSEDKRVKGANDTQNVNQSIQNQRDNHDAPWE